jgi:hypothetical protein
MLPPPRDRTALLLALAPVAFFIAVILFPPINHDVAAVLSFAERWWAGEALYSDLIDVNPPLIFVLNLPPVVIADVLGVDPVAALQFCLIGFGLVVWWLAWRVRDRPAEAPCRRALLDVLPGLMAFGAGYDFGQRETMMVAASLPYLIAAARRAGGERPPVLAAGLLAAIGFALKPHFLAIPVLVELAVLIERAGRIGARDAWGQTWRDHAIWVMALAWLGYLVALLTLFSDYLTIVVPLVWDFYTDQGGVTVWDVVLVPRFATALFLLVPLLVLVVRQGQGGARLPRMVALAAIGAVASAVVQHKGWTYHIVPVELFALALGTLLAADWFDAQPLPQPRRIAAALGGLFALFCVEAGEAPWNEIGWEKSDAFRLGEQLKQEAAGQRVLVLSPGIAPIYPALNYARARMTLRTMNTWLLGGAYQTCLANGARYREVWEMDRPEFFLYRTVAEDFARAPPAMVVVDMSPAIPWCGEEFDFIAYFSRHQLFAEVWSHYRQSGAWGRYRFFVRKD